MGLAKRLVGFLRGVDGGLCALCGGYWWESISGTVGRACDALQPWAPIARQAIEIMPWFGKGHCARQAAEEAKVRETVLGFGPL